MKWKCTLERRNLASFFPRSSPPLIGEQVASFTKTFGEKIKAAIKDPASVDKNLRFFVKKSGFQILNIPILGARDVLVVPAKQHAGIGLTVMLVVGDCRCVYSHAFHRTISISCGI